MSAAVRSSDLSTKQRFATQLGRLKDASPHSYAKLSQLIDCPPSTIHGWCAGNHLPYARDTDRFVHLLRVLGVIHTDVWVSAAIRLRNGTAAAEHRNPYRSTEPMTEADAAVFCGRSTEIAAVLRALESTTQTLGGEFPVERTLGSESIDDHTTRETAHDAKAAVVVVGPSGCGTTSLLRAGVLSRLLHGGCIATYHEPSATLIDDLDRISMHRGISGSRRVVVIDHLETHDAGDERGIAHAIERLLEAGVSVVIGARNGSPPHGPGCLARLDGVNHVTIAISAPCGRELVELIVTPATQLGLEIEPELLVRLSQMFDRRHGDGVVALPLLSKVLELVVDAAGNDRLTMQTYERIGGLRSIMSSAADSVFEGLDPDQQRACELLFVLLIELGDRATLRSRPFDLRDLGAFDTTQPADPVSVPTGSNASELAPIRLEDLHVVIDRFVERRLLTLDRGQILISHDLLLAAWPRLASWIQQQRRAFLVARRVALATEAWRSSDFQPAGLLADVFLAEALDLVRCNPLRLRPLERTLVERSAAARSTSTMGR